MDLIKFLSDSNQYYLNIHNLPEEQEIKELPRNYMRLLKVEEPETSNHNERLMAQEDFMNSLQLKGLIFFYLAHGDQGEIQHYYGLAINLSECSESMDVCTCLEEALELMTSCFCAIFPEGTITLLREEESQPVLDRLFMMECSAVLEGCPGGVSTDNINPGRVTQIMREDEFMILVLARPVSFPAIAMLEKRFQEDMMEISKLIENTKTCEVSETTTCTVTTTTTNLLSDSRNNNCSRQYQFDVLDDVVKGTPQEEAKEEALEEELISDDENQAVQEDIAQSINLENDEETPAEPQTGVRETSPEFPDQNVNGNIKYKNKNNSQSFSDLKIRLNSLTNAVSRNTVTSKTVRTITKQSIFNFTIGSWFTYGNTVLVPRFDYAKGYGLFLYSTMLLTHDKRAERKLEVVMKRYYNNTCSNKVPVKSFELSKDCSHYKAFMNFQMMKYENSLQTEAKLRTMFSQLVDQSSIYAGNFITSKELSKITLLP